MNTKQMLDKAYSLLRELDSIHWGGNGWSSHPVHIALAFSEYPENIRDAAYKQFLEKETLVFTDKNRYLRKMKSKRFNAGRTDGVKMVDGIPF